MTIVEAPDLALLLIRLTGHVDRSVLRVQTPPVSAGQPVFGGYARLVDLRAVTKIDLVFASILELGRRSIAWQTAFGADPIRLCLLSRGDVGYGMSRMYASVVGIPGAPFRVAVVESERDAAAFLKIDLEDLRRVLEMPERPDLATDDA